MVQNASRILFTNFTKRIDDFSQKLDSKLDKELAEVLVNKTKFNGKLNDLTNAIEIPGDGVIIPDFELSPIIAKRVLSQEGNNEDLEVNLD